MMNSFFPERATKVVNLADIFQIFSHFFVDFFASLIGPGKEQIHKHVLINSP